jgi:uncharacterized OsmC-like protein
MDNSAREIVVLAEASSIGGWRKQVIAGQPGAGMHAFISDEGNYMPGGEGTAPTPLTYFTAGMALWLLSHVSQVAIKRKLSIRNERVKVTARFHEQGSVLKGDAAGRCEAFEIELSVDSDEPPEKITALIRLAHQMCFTEDALTGHVRLEKVNLVNGKVVGG